MALKFRKASYLFTGDSKANYEKKMIASASAADLPSHVLKITHHGSESGTCPQFVQHVKPKIAVASTSPADDHRLEDVVRTNLAGCKIFDTDTSGGDIIVRTDGKKRPINGTDGLLYEVEEVVPGLYQPNP